MRVLVFHGYLLHGTGSNVYNANLAAALVRAGHEAHLFCQDAELDDLGWVDAVVTWRDGRMQREARREPARATVYRPDIGRVLPVYVADAYAGFDARPLPELADAEVDAYVAANVAAVRAVAEAVRPEAALANHLVMGPLIVARALAGLQVPYAVKIHGSALEYVVRPHPRFRPAAREGLAGAAGILVGSRHTAESLWEVMDDPGLPARTRLGPPGVDIDAFTLREPGAAARGLESLRARLAGAPAAAPATGGQEEPAYAEATGARTDGSAHAEPGTAPEPAAAGPASAPAGPVPASSFRRDPARAAQALAALDLAADRPVVFVGKLIGSKGVELLLAAWPLVLARVPSARLVLVGFGAFEAGLRELEAQLVTGDLAGVAATRSETGAELPWLTSFAESLDGDAARAYAAAAAQMSERVLWTGRLEHGELHDLLPAMEAMVVPSTFPEAFGMVAAEAAACGALPVVAGHSGLAEVARTLAAAVPEEVRPLLSFDIGPGAVEQIAAAVVGWLSLPDDVRREARAALARTAQQLYSWDGVARTVIAAARGQIGGLPEP